MPSAAPARYTAAVSGAFAAMAAILPILIFVIVVALGNRVEFGSFD